MVKKDSREKDAGNQAGKTDKEHVTKITADTEYAECSERLTAFGGMLALEKFLDLIGFEAVFEDKYVAPKRETKLGDYRMTKGILLLLFIGFQRLGHFAYLRSDSMLCGILKVSELPVVSTFWRYLRSLGINQSGSILRMQKDLRAKTWELCKYKPEHVTVNIDTTVSTVYGDTEGARKGHNTKHRGKKGLRPVLCFLAETREYICGTQRKGETMSNEEVARQIRQFRRLLPESVKRISVRGDGEFIGWESVEACLEEGIGFTFGNKRCAPPFANKGWYKHGNYEYNECMYQPIGWAQPCRFVVMRIHKDDMGERQLNLLESSDYVYRVFVTDKKKRPHKVIKDYDKRADAENCIEEAQQEGVLAIPSKRFQTHYAFFQIVMLAYNLWRWMKMLAEHSQRKQGDQVASKTNEITIADHTIRIARLKLLFVAAKICFHSNRDEVRYSLHNNHSAGLIDFLKYLDARRKEEGLAA